MLESKIIPCLLCVFMVCWKHVTPDDRKTVHQGIDLLKGMMIVAVGKMGVFGSGQNADMPHDLLKLNQINPGFQKMGGKAVAQGMAGDLFFKPI